MYGKSIVSERNRKSLLRSRKAISPVISTLVLVSVAIAMSIVVAYWIMGINGSLTRFNNWGETLELQETMTLTPQGIGISTATASAVGDNPANYVIMTQSGASANTALTQGNFEYRLKVEIARRESFHVGKKYSVELFVDGTEHSKGTVYIGQPPSWDPVGYYVIIKWNLGTSLDDSVYEIQVLPA